MNRTALVACVAILTPFVTVAFVSAGPQARVAGTIIDSSGVPVTGATITITSAELPKYRKVLETAADGEFRVLLLDATKTYVFTVEAAGFVEYAEEIKVSVGSTDNQFTFELSTLKEQQAERQQEIREQPGYKEFGEAGEFLEQGKTAEARAKFEDALEAMPDMLEALEAVAAIDYDSGDNELALASAKRCLDEDDESIKCLAVAANAAGALGDDEAREAYLARYQALNPDDPATIFNSAVVYLNKLDDDSAKPLLEQCLAADPEFGKCLFEYGMLLLRSGDLEGAKQQLEKYLSVEPDGPDATAASETVKYL
jgi:tetratricopeptide (TPR) repeat protein